MSGENKPEEAPVVFLCGWCFHGGPGGRQLRLKHLMENCFWFCCAQQFTIPRDGPKGHLLSLKKTPAVPVLAAFPAGSFHFCLPGFPDAGCESLAILFEEGVLESLHYPEHYSNTADCQWIIRAPKDHVVKVQHEPFLCLQDGSGHHWVNKKLCS